jgi:hypothetical protein
VIGRLNNYLEIVGKDLPEGGWTKFYRANKPVQLSRSRWAIWVFLNAVAVIFAAYVWSHGPLVKEGAKPANVVSTAQIKAIEAQQRLLISLFAAQQEKVICPTGLQVASPGGPRSQRVYECKGKSPATN